MKTFTYLLAAALLTSACSTTSSTTDGASTGGSTVTDASSSNNSSSATGTSGTSTDVVGGSGGSYVGSGTNTGTAAGSSNTNSGRTATDIASDVNAFAGTFATMDDATFMLTAASSNMLEVQMGQLAAQRAANADVKKFGQMMVDHHGMATQKWQTVAKPLGIAMPTTLMPVHQTMLEQVMNKSGKNFDEAYMDAMETAHKLDVAMFEVKSRAAQAPAVQTFATQTLPMLRSHEKMSSELEKKVD